MTGRPHDFADEDLSAFIDGELEAGRARLLERALHADPALAARIDAFAADRQNLAALYAPIAEAPIPDDWRTRIEAATAPESVSAPAQTAQQAGWQAGLLRDAPARTSHRRPPVWRRRPALGLALAACLAVLAVATRLRPNTPATDPILTEAAAARRDLTPPHIRLTGLALADESARDATLRQATGLAVRAPNLAAQHFHLVELETYTNSAALRYRSDTGQSLTLYVRPSAGPPRFDLLRDGAIRTCIWQDEVVGAVMMGDMTAGQMMRVASAAYLELNL